MTLITDSNVNSWQNVIFKSLLTYYVAISSCIWQFDSIKMTHSSPWPVQWPGHQLRQRKAGHDASVPPCSTRSPVCQFRQSNVMCGQTMMSVTLVLVLSVKLANSDIKLETCSSSHQVTALDLFSRHSCQPRQEIVQLEVPSDMNIVQVCYIFAPSGAGGPLIIGG